MDSIVPHDISADVDLGGLDNRMYKVEGVVGDNIECLVYLDVQTKRELIGLSWRPRSVLSFLSSDFNIVFSFALGCVFGSLVFHSYV